MLSFFINWGGGSGGGGWEGSVRNPQENPADEYAEAKRIILDQVYKILEKTPQDHLITLFRKRKMLRIQDDYGVVDDAGWRRELE